MHNSRNIRALAALFIAALIIACGGGGGGGGNSSNPGVVLNLQSASLAFNQSLNLTGSVPGLSNQTIRWAVSGGSITPTGASSATYTAPAVAGTYTIRATADGDASRKGECTVVVSQIGIEIDPQSVTLAPGKTTAFNANVLGSANTNATFTATGGTLTTTGPHSVSYRAPAATGTYTVTARATANTSRTSTATVVVANVGSNATVTGRILVDGTSIGISGLTVQFFNATGSEVGRATTNATGSFSAQVPASAKRFHILSSSISASYYKAYEYRTVRYSALVVTCTAPLPALTAGASVALPGTVQVPSVNDPPPPPPNGCG